MKLKTLQVTHLTLQVPFACTVSITPTVNLPESGMNCHLRFYHLPPLHPLGETVKIMYPINYPSPHYVFDYIF